MQILLTTLNAKYIHMNLAVRLLYEYNKQHEGLAWKEFTIKEDKAEIAQYCSQFEVVAFSCYIWNITPTLLVAKLIKEINPAIKILLGGPEVSYEWQNVIADEAIDYIITGEGEIPFQNFLEQYPSVDLVPNLVRKIGEEVRYNPQSVMFDLKNYETLNPYINDGGELYNKVSYIETSRGCPYKCEFCLASLDNKVRYLPNNNIKANLLYLMQHGRVIKFLDRTFNIKRDFTIDIFEFILKHHRPENVFQFEITADILHPDIVAFIDEQVPKGLFRFEIGIQTVNQKANLEVSRKQSFDKTRGVIQSLSHKIEMHLDLIVGLPLDEWEDTKYSFEEVFKLFAPELQLGFLKFLKGTPMRDKYEQHEYVFDPMPPYQIIQSKYLSKRQLAQIVQLENALEIYWNKRRADLTLRYITNYYSIFDFLLGLGNYFEQRTSFHKHTANDIYEHLFHFAKQQFADDPILHEIIAIDYYLFHKIKPKVQYVNEIARSEKNEMINKLHLNHHQNRYAILPISFNYETFKNEMRIEKQTDNLIIQYAENKTPTVISNMSTFSSLMTS
jgi:anaerobic magnesium-protoporphyrin IX monomethyl ester cyclase